MLFFERQKTLRNEWPELLKTDVFPINVKEQCWQILDIEENTAEKITKILKIAIGVSELSECYHHSASSRSELRNFFYKGLYNKNSLQNVEYSFSVLELMCLAKLELKSKIEQVNLRLRLGGIAYKFGGKELIPLIDENLTKTAVIPVISLLNQPKFKKSYDYIQSAFDYYQSGKPDDLESAIDNTQKAVECLLKIIFDDLQISYGKGATLMPLVQIAKKEGFFPDIGEDKLNALVNMLKGLGEIRNKAAGHAQNREKPHPKEVRLALHHATANMLYIAETYFERT